jgi:MFS family permease
MRTTSIWTALWNPVFRRLWLASVLSGCFVSAHDVAATWVMNTLTPSQLLLSLLSTAASLPFFLLTFPAGALADTMDRKKLLCGMNLWLALVAGSLAILGWLHLLNPWVILSAVFLLGVGFACNAPAWTSVISGVVAKEELASPVTLGGVQMNLSCIIGPAIGGILLPLIGANALFALNSAGFLIIMIAIKRWHQEATQSKMPLKTFLESFAGAVRYALYTRGIQVLLVRAFLFALLISVIPALLPVVGLKALHLSSSSLGLLFTTMGIGSLVGAVLVIPLARERYRPNTVTILASLLLAIIYCLMAYVRHLEAFMVVAALGGLSWTLAASELWVAAQQAMPDWTRGRMNAAQIMTSQGGVVLGGNRLGRCGDFRWVGVHVVNCSSAGLFASRYRHSVIDRLYSLTQSGARTTLGDAGSHRDSGS